MGRLAQAVVGTEAARFDDPILIVAGNVVERQELIFVRRVVNLKLAYHFDNCGVLATIKHGSHSELQELIARTLHKNAVVCI